MKLIIDIDEEILTLIKAHGHLKCDDIDNVRFALEYGTPIDKGDLIMFNLLMTTIADKGLPFEEVLLLIDNAKTPYNPSGDLISRSELKKYAIPCQIHNGALTDLCIPLYQIDNAKTPYNPTGDCISREALKERLNELLKTEPSSLYGCGLRLAIENIDNAPTVEPEIPQGEWARHDEWRGGEYIGGFYHVNCPCDDGYFVKWRMKYCGNCGAPMQLNDMQKGGEVDG